MKATQKCIDLIKRWELFRAEPYLCAAGVPTIGYGTTFYPNGKRVTLADPKIDKATAERYLRAEVVRVERHIEPQLTAAAITSGMWDAIVSFVYNVGTDNFARSTLLKKLKRGDFQAAAMEFPKWNKARVDGELVVLRGLTARRKEEQALFLS